MSNTLGIVMLTYTSSLESPRHMYAMRTWESLVKNVKYSGKTIWHVADDGSPPGHVSNFGANSATNSNRKGYGASFNLATQVLHEQCEYLLMVEDDWELTRELNLDRLTQALDNVALGCIRLGYLGWTKELSGWLTQFAGQTFLKFDPQCEENHVWSGHPRLESRSYQRRVGPWPEGLDPGSTEFEVAKRTEARRGVGWPMDLGMMASQSHDSLFRHIGSVQARTDQVAV